MVIRERRRLSAGWADRRTLAVDLGLYAFFAAFALGTAFASGLPPHRLWGIYACAGYAVGAAYTAFLLVTRPSPPLRWWQSRWTAVGAIVAVGLIAPLVQLLMRRIGDPSTSTADVQPEVGVIERSARQLIDTGTPYVDVTALGRPPVVDDYTPYGPVMAVFGLPRAIADKLGIGDVALVEAVTDGRVVFIAVATACVLLSLRLLGNPSVPVSAAQLAVICPATALTFAVAAPDLAILGLLVLAVVLTVRRHAVLAGVILALVVSAKLTAAPAVLVLVVLVAARDGWRPAAKFGTALVGTAVAVTLPSVLVDPAAFVEHVIAFPAGAGAVSSPAASPLPGYLIAHGLPAGHTIALVLLGIAAVAIGLWVVLRPPLTGADAMLRIAVGLGTATLLTPATRWGYLVYPLVLLGARLCIPDDAAEPRPQADLRTPDEATSSSA